MTGRRLANPFRGALGAALAAALLSIPPLMIWADKPLALYMKAQQDEGFRAFFDVVTLLGESQYSLVPAGVLGLVLWAVIKFGNLDELKRATCLKVAQAAGFVFACVALGGIATNIVKALVGRARPKLLFREETYGFDPLILDASWHSFPSGHTNSAIAAALALAMLFPKVRWPLLMLGGLIAFSRVAVTAHYMADIVGGTVLAVLTCWFVGKYFAHKNWLFTESPAGLTVRP